MLQGDTNSPATFMRVMEDLFCDYLHDFVWVYIDDILIFSETPEQHVEHITKVCNKLREARFYASPDKTQFFAKRLELLGHIVTDEGILAAPEKIRDIKDWTIPKSRKELERFLGLVNYISQFLPHHASLTAPLTSLTGKAEFLWTDIHTKAFNQIKQLATDAKVLRPINYKSGEPIFLFADASIVGTGSWVGQGPTPYEARPAMFHSRKFTNSQTNYTTTEQETLAIIEALRAFYHVLQGTFFTIVTDHEALQSMKTKTQLSRRQHRWLAYLNIFDYNIKYEPGSTNYLADALSRIYDQTPSANDD